MFGCFVLFFFGFWPAFSDGTYVMELRRQIHDGSCWLLVASLFSFIAAAQPVRRLAQTKGASWIAGGSRCDGCSVNVIHM